MRIIDVLTSPWAIMPEKLVEIQNIYLTHLRGPKIDLEGIEAQIGKPLKNERKPYEVDNGVAIIPVEGVIAKKMNLLTKISGGVSTQLAERDFKAALADPQVRAILLYVDSPGGAVDGVQEFAEAVREARGQKPVVAFTDGLMASAAYWIGSAADLLYISGNTNQVGSIGVVAVHKDVSRAEENAGVKTTEIYAGKYKRIASQYGPLSEEGRAEIQDQVDYLYRVFVEDVARNRGLSVPEEGAIPWADGRVFLGRRSVEAGLVDGVSSMARLMDRLREEPNFVGREQIRIKSERRLQR